jgi:hypothetical protein
VGVPSAAPQGSVTRVCKLDERFNAIQPGAWPPALKPKVYGTVVILVLPPWIRSGSNASAAEPFQGMDRWTASELPAEA